MLGPVLLKPFLRLTGKYQFTSPPDFSAFRHWSQATGILITLTTECTNIWSSEQ